MIAALIFVISVAAMLQFFVSYCRSLIAARAKEGLSEQVREVARIENRGVGGEDFRQLLQLVRLCPEPGDDNYGIHAVRTYYSLLNCLRLAVRSWGPSMAAWAEQERAGCAYFAAVTLDRRIAYSRELMAQQISNR